MMQQSSEPITTRVKRERPVCISSENPQEWQLNGIQVAIRLVNPEDWAWLIQKAGEENQSLCNTEQSALMWIFRPVDIDQKTM